MFELILAVGVAVLISAFCSITEAALYSLPWSRIEHLRRQGKSSGHLLFKLRSNVEEPITAILTLNTVANTAGAAVAGAAAARVFGQEALPMFALFFTATILLLSEIIPKTLGIMYTRGLSPFLAKPLQVMIWVTKPISWFFGLAAKLIRRGKRSPHATEEDIRAMVSLTRKAGILKPYEELSITGILSLDQKIVRNIMTPRTVVFSLPSSLTVEAARHEKTFWPHSRIPVFEDDDPEDIVGIVYRRDVLQALAEDQDNMPLSELMKPVQFVVETLTLDKLLIKFLGSRTHLLVVLDEYGGVAGVVTLEDVLEEILGKEIMDETDEVADLREYARHQRENITRPREEENP